MIQCLQCGYRLEHLPEHRCSECGRGFNPNDPSTFDSNRRAFRSARLCLCIAVACSMYAMLFIISMVVTVAARFIDNASVMEISHDGFSVLACCTPLILILQGSMMVAAPFCARYERANLWGLWWLVLAIGAVSWMSAAAVLLSLLAALMI